MHLPGPAAALGTAALLAWTGLSTPAPSQPVPRARVAGTLTTPERRPLLSAAAILVPRDQTQPIALEPDRVELHPDGRFSFGNVPPGRYELRVRAEIDPRRPMTFGSYAFTVEGRDIDGLVVPLVEGTVIDGRVRWDGRAPAGVGDVRVRAPLADGSSFGDSLTGAVSGDGAFHIRGVMPGAHFLHVEGLPDPWGVRAVYLQGRDVSDRPLDAEAGGRVANVLIVLSDTLPDLGGVVRDSGGAPAAGALVIAMPPAGGSMLRGSLRFRSTLADAAGRFQLRALMPGEYRVVAIAGVTDARMLAGTVLSRLSAQARVVQAGPASVDLTAATVAAAAR